MPMLINRFLPSDVIMPKTSMTKKVASISGVTLPLPCGKFLATGLDDGGKQHPSPLCRFGNFGSLLMSSLTCLLNGNCLEDKRADCYTVLCTTVVHYNIKTRTSIVFMTELGPVVPVG